MARCTLFLWLLAVKYTIYTGSDIMSNLESGQSVVVVFPEHNYYNVYNTFSKLVYPGYKIVK